MIKLVSSQFLAAFAMFPMKMASTVTQEDSLLSRKMGKESSENE